MKILFNLSIVKTGGGLQVALSILDEWRSYTEHQYYVLISPNIASSLSLGEFPDNFNFKAITISPANPLKSISIIHNIERLFIPDIVFTLFGPSYWKPQAPHLCGYALPHFIYPESPFFTLISFKERIKWKILGYLKFRSLKNHCDYYITETEDASNRLAAKLKIQPSKVFTVNNAYNGVFDILRRWRTRETENKLSSTKGFKLLTISSFYPHKNLGVILDVIDYFVSKYPTFNFTFILTIKPDEFPSLTEQQKRHILFLGKVTIEECPPLYQQADALFMPTLLECFTVSYLEAMKMEKPILTSDLPFARDICRDAACYFEPLDPIDIGEKIVKLADDRILQTDLTVKGTKRLKDFGTAEDRAKKYIQILEKIVNKNNSLV